MSDIPRARELIAKAAQMLPAHDPARVIIEMALPMMTRESPVKRSDQKSRPLDLNVACEIWRYYRRQPFASHQEIGNALRVNPGRVSEVLSRQKYTNAETITLKELRR